MARKKSKSGSGAMSSSIARRSLPDPLKLVRAVRVSSTLRAIEDRRTWHPEGEFRPARSFNKARHALVVKKSPASSSGRFRLPTRVMFDAPKKVLICVRRQRRKEVIFAKGKAGGGRRRSPTRNWYSDVSC